MARRCEEWHGGCAGDDSFAFNEANWYLVRDDNKYLGWINSWRDMVGLPDLMEQLLQYLLVWPWFPVVWLDKDANRTNAPLFVVARYGKGKAPHTCFFQFGCRYCQHQTELLYPAAQDDMSRYYAEQQLMKFFEPLLRRYKLQRGSPYLSISQMSLRLTASSLDSVTKRHEGCQSLQLRAAGPPVSAQPLAAQSIEQRPQWSGTWAKYIDPQTNGFWWHNDATGEFFFEATGTARRPETSDEEGTLQKLEMLDEEDGSTEAGDSCSSCTCGTFSVDDSTCTASCDCPVIDLRPLRRPGRCYSGLCTHRTYAKNLYFPGQLAVINEDFKDF